MNKIITAIFAVALAISFCAVNAAEIEKTNTKASKSASADKSKLIEAKLHKRFPATQVTSVQKSPIKGIYEVLMGKNIAYIDENADMFLFGHIFDMATQQDITQAKQDGMNRVDFDKLPLDKAIKVVKGDGSREFAVFTDPDCPYCKQLEASLAELDNYTMYVLLYPIAQLHPEASAHADAIWCADDKVAAWHTFMTVGKLPTTPAKKDCVSPVADIAPIGHSLGVEGTPTLVSKSGKITPGAPQGKMLEAVLFGASMPSPTQPPKR